MTLPPSRRRLLLASLLALVMRPPQAGAATPELAHWAGRYVDPDFNQTLDIDARGHVRSTGAVFLGGDAGMAFHATGTLVPDAGQLTLTLQADREVNDNADLPDALRRPRRLLPFEWQGRRFLLDDAALLGIVNNVNLQDRRVVPVYKGMHELFASEEYARSEVQVDADAVLPPAYRAHLLARPLAGHVTRVVASVAVEERTGPSSFPVGPPRLEPPGPPLPPVLPRRTTVEIDLGSADGVFPGMMLNVSARGDDYFLVDHVEARRCNATRIVFADVATGTAVTSTASYRRPR